MPPTFRSKMPLAATGLGDGGLFHRRRVEGDAPREEAFKGWKKSS